MPTKNVAESSPSSPPFLVVAGAGYGAVNGRYAQEGVCEGRPKFKKLNGEFTVIFKWGQWKLGCEDDSNVWIYEGPTSRSPVGASGWACAANSKYHPAPTLSFGTCRDLQEGDVVTIIKLNEEVDWSGCPEAIHGRRLSLTSTPWTVTIHRLRRLRGNWFYPTESPEKVAPLAALGLVNLMGKPHRITEVKEDSAACGSGEGDSLKPFLVVAGAGYEVLNGRYVPEGTFSGKAKYKQVDGNSIIFFMAGKWRLNDEEVTDERCYDAAESAGHGAGHGDTPPLGAWVQINNRYGPAPMLSLGTYRDLQEGDSVVLDKNSRSMDWSQCPETNEGNHLSFKPPLPVKIHRLLGSWFYPLEFPTLVAPLSALGVVKFRGQAYRVSEVHENCASILGSILGEDTAPIPFLVVRGAGHAPVNGRYAYVAVEADRPKYKQVGGNSIIYFSSGVWRLNDEENMQQRKYDGAQNDTPTPPNQWVQVDPNYGAAPKLSEGTWRDIHEGDIVTIEKRHEDFDWSGCPVNDAGRLRFSPSSWTITVQRVQGDWFYPAEFETLIAPLAALGTVNLMGKAHRISDLCSGSKVRRQKTDVSKAKIMGGYDEEWCESDVQKFKCAICLLVARTAMVHECGSDLFCEGCWEKCMAKDSKCPVCREDGASIVPAHFARRCIGNLMIKCPNGCGQTFHLYDKENHLQDMCSWQKGVVHDETGPADEENKEICSACSIS